MDKPTEIQSSPLSYHRAPDGEIPVANGSIPSFDMGEGANIDPVTVASFGEEWKKFHRFSDDEIENIGNEYFDIVTPEMLNANTVALDLGCGSGRWSCYTASRAGFVEAIDPSEAVLSASVLTEDLPNVRVTQAGVDNIPFADHSFDFILCLGVLHHVPDTAAALATAAKKLKPGGWFLLYLYYALDNRGAGYRFVFHCSTLIRRVISSLPAALKKPVCDLIALGVYVPFVALSKVVKAIFGKRAYEKVPLHYYSDKTWRVIRNDALDRFGTPLEQRFSKAEITEMMKRAGLGDLQFSEGAPFWHVVGKKQATASH